MKNLLCAAAIISLLALTHIANAETVQLSGDTGCDSLEVQQMRVSLTKIALTSKDPEAKHKASERIVGLTQKRCATLDGKYQVQARSQGFLKVSGPGGRPLWVIE